MFTVPSLISIQNDMLQNYRLSHATYKETKYFILCFVVMELPIQGIVESQNNNFAL